MSKCVKALKKESLELQTKYATAVREYDHLCGRGIEGLTMEQMTRLGMLLKDAKSRFQEHREALLEKKLKEQEEKLTRMTDEKDREVACVVCLDRPRATICEPCKHFAACVVWYVE